MAAAAVVLITAEVDAVVGGDYVLLAVAELAELTGVVEEVCVQGPDTKKRKIVISPIL